MASNDSTEPSASASEGAPPFSSSAKPKSKASSSSTPRPWFATPAPIRRLFAHFPLQTLPANSVPTSSTSAYIQSSPSAQKSTLYIFTTPAEARRGAPSFNPSCLKWQAWLRVQGVDVHLVSSNNHASPSGALPFLLLPESAGDAQAKLVTAGKLYTWAQEHGRGIRAELKGLSSMREEAYLSLIDHRIRAAWLHTLYLTPNFQNIVYPLYVAPCSSMAPVRFSIANQLRAAARQSLHQISPQTSYDFESYLKYALHAVPGDQDDAEAKALYKHATEAFLSLSTLLGQDEWFFGAKEPGLLDVGLFAYTHLLLDDELGDGWADTRARRGLQDCSNLVRHRKRLYKRCFALEAF